MATLRDERAGQKKRTASGDDNGRSVAGEKLFAGVDIGGTTIHVGIVSGLGEIQKSSDDKAGVQAEDMDSDNHDPKHIVARVCQLTEAALHSIGRRLSDLEALGVCTPGLLDHKAGVVRAAANLRGWKDVPLVDMLAQTLGFHRSRVVLEHDTNAALLAEAWTGSAAGLEHIVLLTLGTGIGGAIMCDGRLLRGSKGQAGEIGHAIHVPDGRSHGGTGVKGIFEGYASATAVALRATEGGLPAGSSLKKLKKAVECKDVFDHASEGDEHAAAVVRETAKHLAIGCINCCRYVDPELILFSGGMAEAGETFLAQVREEFERHHWNLEPVRVQMRLASFRRNAGLVGAARAAVMAVAASYNAIAT